MNLNKNYHQIFEEELNRLNTAQRRAVERIEGVSLVIAGPGTGKTHILSARIGRILQKTDVYPHNILCLTYTDAGTVAMRQRLLQFIGTDAHKVPIYTFHSFCNNILQDNIEQFGVRDFKPVSELERIEIVRTLLDELPSDHLLQSLKTEKYPYEKHLLHLFSVLKSENWTVSTIQQAVEKYLIDLPNKDGFFYKKSYKQFLQGDPKTAKINEERQRMERLVAAALLFDRFDTLMKQRQRYDFEDMLQWVCKAFEQNVELLRRYQEQYLYVLIDEFQDTNGVQNQILNLLMGFWEQPNLFAVGDDDQSIFEFQGARVKNIENFYERYQPDVELIVLNENYRSSQSILDAAKAVISYNQLRLNQISKNLQARSAEFAVLTSFPQIIVFPNPLHEAISIVQTIEILQQQSVCLSEIAIIYAQHKQAVPILRLLDYQNIPYQTKRPLNLFDDILIQNILTIFRYLRKEYETPEQGDNLLFQILHFEFFNIKATDLACLSLIVKAEKTSWRRLLNNSESLEKSGIKNPGVLIQLRQLFDQLRKDQFNEPLTVIFERLLNRSGLLKFVIEHPDKVALMQVLTTFFDFLTKETTKNPKLNLARFLELVGQMEDNHIALPLQQAVFKEEGVQLVTAHSSKGLEFEYVFMLDCAKDRWQPTKKNPNTFKFPDTLVFSSGAEDDLEAARRLFYVAMTRAKRSLQLSFSLHDANGKPRERTQFLDELQTQTALPTQERPLAETSLLAGQIALLSEPSRPRLPQLDSLTLDALLENFTLSATSLSRFLDCSLSFYYENVLKAPTLTSEAAAYGTSIHYALKRWLERQHLTYPRQTTTPALLLRDFEAELERHRPFLNAAQLERRKALGNQVLPEYFKGRQANFERQKVEALELGVRNVVFQGVPLVGFVDKIEAVKGSQIRVVDYKTGKFIRQKSQPPTEDNPNGGDYWRQLVFYKILLENYQKRNWQVVSGAIDFVEPDEKKQFFPLVEIELNSESVRVVAHQITETYQKIKNHDFMEGCGKNDCLWCNFTRQHHLAERYHRDFKAMLDE